MDLFAYILFLLTYGSVTMLVWIHRKYPDDFNWLLWWLK